MREDDLKVRDLSTAQSPKATDFVMLITNLTNNVLEKCQISALREVLTTNNISDDEGNALTTGSDDKLYVEDLSESIGIVQSNLENFQNETETSLTNLSDIKANIYLTNITSDAKQNIINCVMPDYTAGITAPNGFVAPKDGWVRTDMYFHTEDNRVFINGINVAGNRMTWQGDYSDWRIYDFIPIVKGATLTYRNASGNTAVFYPCKGVR